MDRFIVRKQSSKKKSVEPGFWVRTEEKNYWATPDSDWQEDIDDVVGALSRNSAVHFDLRLFRKWPEDFRGKFMELAKRTGTYVVSARKDAARENSLFTALLTLVGTAPEVEESQNLLYGICQAAAIEHPNGIGETARRIVEAYQKVGITHRRGVIEQVIGKLAGKTPTKSKEIAELIATRFVRTYTKQPAKGDEPSVPGLIYYRGQWYRYSGESWNTWTPEFLKARIAQFWINCRESQTPVSDSLVRDVIANLKGMCLVYPDHTDMPLWWTDDLTHVPSPFIACKNGLLDLRPLIADGALPLRSAFTPRHFSTVKIGASFNPFVGCPRWKRALAQIFKRRNDNDNRVRVLQEFFGWTLYCGLRLEKFLVLYGSGSNGKSTILNVLRILLGQANVSNISIEHLGSEHRLVELDGKLANIAGDMNRVERFEEGVLKQLVSGDPVQVNPKYRSPYTMTPIAKIIFATNQLPTINDRSDGMLRRMIAMPLYEKFDGDNCDVGLGNKLLTELPGILTWSLTGLARLARNERFTECSVCNQSNAQHRIHCDPFLQFIDEKCILGPNQEDEQSGLYVKYSEWCEKNGRRPTGSSEFYDRVLGLDGVRERRPGTVGRRPRMFEGISYYLTAQPVPDR